MAAITGRDAAADVIADRLAAQLLAGPAAGSVVDVARRLLAVQAQDLRGTRLAVRARTRGLTAADIDRALGVDRSVVISWLNRGTLHLVPREDYGWLHQLLAPGSRTSTMTRLRQEGVSAEDAERGVAAIVDALADGPLTRAQLRDRVAAAGIRAAGQALVHLLFLAVGRNLIVRGPFVGNEQAFVLLRDWLDEPADSLDRDESLARLAARYLGGHGPANERDLAKWAGLSLGDVRRGLRSIGGRLVERPDGLLDLADRPARAGCPARLLGPFDPLLLGWASREPILGEHQHVVTVNGIFRPVALVDGRAVGTWRLERQRVVLEPFDQRTDLAAHPDLAAEAEDVGRFLWGNAE